MKAIAWDDSYEADIGDDHMSLVRQELVEMTDRRIDLTIYKDPNEFISVVNSGQPFDFFITDWFDERRREGLHDARGAQIISSIRHCNHTAPIFVVSAHMEKIDEQLLTSTRPVFFKSKRSPAHILAHDILETLRDLSLLTSPQKVFLIYGHDRKAEGARAAVHAFLRDRGIEPVIMESKHSCEGIMPDLLREMRNCAAFIAICTPDDRGEDGQDPPEVWWQPRQNVIFEMGMVYGSARGAERMTVLQKWVDGDPMNSARLPNDWGGYATLRFDDSITDRFGELEYRLKRVGVGLKEPVSRS